MVVKQVKIFTLIDFYIATQLQINNTQRLFYPLSNIPDYLKIQIATFPTRILYTNIQDWPADNLQSFIYIYLILYSNLDNNNNKLIQENLENSKDKNKDISSLENRSNPDLEDLEDKDKKIKDLEKLEESKKETFNKKSEEE